MNIKRLVSNFHPLLEINDMNIKVDVEGGINELIDGSIDIANLQKNTSYYFYTDVLEGQKLNISFTTDSSSSTPFSSVNIYENSDIGDLSRLKTATISVSQKEINDKLFTSFSYTISKNYCKYIFIEIKPSFIINDLIAKVVKEVESYNLIENEPKIISNLKSEKFYYFNFKMKKYSKVTIYLTIDNVNDKPFNYTYLYRYDNENPSFSKFYKINEYYYNTYSKITDNKSVTGISYKSQRYYEEYLSFAFKPFYNFDSIRIDTIQEIYAYEMTNFDSQKITNLLYGTTYYLYTSFERKKNLMFILQRIIWKNNLSVVIIFIMDKLLGMKK